VIGAVLGILTWFQVAACLLLYGACVSAITAPPRSDGANAPSVTRTSHTSRK